MKRYLPVIFLFSPAVLNAQRKTTHTNMLWGSYYFNIPVGKRWSVNSDMQIRTRDWTSQWSQVLARTGISYKVNDHLNVTAGFAWFKNVQYSAGNAIFKNEYRPWQEVSYNLGNAKNKFIQRLRFEQRFMQQAQNGKLVDAYDYISRLRYKLDEQLKLSPTISLVAANEVMVNPFYVSSNRFFDQDRITAGIQWKASASVSLQWQYIKIYQWKSSVGTLDNQDVLRFVVYHKMGTGKKKQ